MKKCLVSLAVLVSVFSLMSFVGPQAEVFAPSSMPKGSIQLPKVPPGEVMVLKEMLKKQKTKPVKQLTPDQLNKLKNLPPNTSVSSYGEIVTPEQQKAYLQRHPYRFPTRPEQK
jgi:hypothetical protein